MTGAHPAASEPRLELLSRLGLIRTLVSGSECYGYPTPASIVLIFNVCSLPLIASALTTTLGELISSEDDPDCPDWVLRTTTLLGEVREGQRRLWSLRHGIWVMIMPWQDRVTTSVRIGLSDQSPLHEHEWLFEAFGVARGRPSSLPGGAEAQPPTAARASFVR